MKSSLYPLCDYVSEDKDSVDRKEPIYTSLILSTLGPFTVGGKDMVSMDVTSLYTNIPQEEGIKTVCEAYRQVSQ